MRFLFFSGLIAIHLLFYTGDSFVFDSKIGQRHACTKSNAKAYSEDIESRSNEIRGLFRRNTTWFPSAGESDKAGNPIDFPQLEQAEPIKTIIEAITARSRKLNTGTLSLQKLSTEIKSLVSDLEQCTNALLGSDSTLSPDLRDTISAVLKDSLGTICRQGALFSRSICKPRGYAGDFQTIDMIYNYEPPQDLSPLGHAVDQAFLSFRAAKAVQNRRGMLVKEFSQTKAKKGTEPTEITALACGPAREIHDFLRDGRPQSKNATFHLVDIDEEALEFVDGWKRNMHPSTLDQVKLYQKNILRLCCGREKLNLPPQDLVYSMGLIDYFSDKVVIRFLDHIYDMLRPGGKVILGNFHKCNPTRGLMETIMDWKLNHRDENDMHRLFEASKFGSSCSSILRDPEGVQLLACCEKEQ
jgi:SAM-dependent methyltransferase